jgi:hypothetical protein
MSEEFDNPFARKRRAASPSSSTSPSQRKETSKALGKRSVMHGSYENFNFRLPPEHVSEIKQWADELDLTQADIKRWIVARGLLALRKGERPDLEIEERRTVKPLLD